MRLRERIYATIAYKIDLFRTATAAAEEEEGGGGSSIGGSASSVRLSGDDAGEGVIRALASLDGDPST